MLSRPHLTFGSFDLKQVPRAKRKQALQLKLKQWSPHIDSGHYSVWQGDTVSVWCWDAARLNRLLGDAKLDARRVRIVPESVYYPRHSNGIRLLKCLSGYEAQRWRDDRLLHSRWWPALPDGDTWLAFQRDASVQPHEQCVDAPAAATPAMLELPWADTESGAGNTGLRNEKLAVVAGVFLLSLSTLYFGLVLMKFRGADQARQAEISEMQETGRPVLDARRLALDDLARINVLRGLDSSPSQLALMAKVAETLPKDEMTLKEWAFQNGSLKITFVSTAQLSSSNLVNAFQTTGMFSNVKALPGNDPKIMTLQMDVIGARS